MNFGLLFKKCTTAREFVDKSKLERVRTVGFIETDGSVGSVMYASDWNGERPFDRYEYKSN